ncbi:MAG: hypothetical protein PVH48_07225 [Cyclobacteriaceae bacterium]|jgi:hypothetical protein
MNHQNKDHGYAIALAWPETYCKQAGAWYDNLMHFIGISTNFHYKVGHAAVILVDGKNGDCHYFDFGRYHAPYGHGRIRNKITDHDLTIHSKAIISPAGKVNNLHEILSEVYHNPSCHGTGPVHAALTKIRFDLAYNFALKMQKDNPWKYGPFIWNGTNCSRFVRSIILSGIPALKQVLRLKLPLTLSPTPLGIVKTLGGKTVFQLEQNNSLHNTSELKSPVIFKRDLRETLQIPAKVSSIPPDAQWLAGEGAGSWFHIEQAGTRFIINRYNELGDMECTGFFIRLGEFKIILTKPFKFIHISHCDQVTIMQYGKKITLKRFEIKNIKQKYDPNSNLLTQSAS